MKKIMVLALAFCIAFAGCSAKDPQIDPELVVMEVTSKSGTELSFEIKNNSNHNIVFGNNYYFEHKEGEEWVKMADRTQAYFTEIAHILEPGETYKSSVNFEARYGALSDGTYRIVKEMRFENFDGTDFGGQLAAAEFEVTVRER